MSRGMDGCLARYRALLQELERQAGNAARRNKPTMWAYYLSMVDGLREWFDDVEETGEAYRAAALALSDRAERECPRLPPGEAARLWALGIYARRLLPPGSRGRVSLAWLRRAAGLGGGDERAGT